MIEYAGYRVILKLKWDGANKIWMLTGFSTSDKRKNPDEADQFYSLERLYALDSYKVSRNQVGAGRLNESSKNSENTRVDIRLVKPKYQFKTEKEAWDSVAQATGLQRDEVKAAHTGKSWRWEKGLNRKNPDLKNYSRTDIRLIKPKYQLETEDEVGRPRARVDRPEFQSV